MAGAEPTVGTREQWSSEPAFIYSMAAAAVGLGNLWRFPYMVGENGGAAFIIAYLLALVFVVVPLMILEVAAGRLAEGNAVHTFRRVHRWGGIYGWFVVGLTTVITSYYLVVTGWTLGYAVDAVRGSLVPFADFASGYRSLYYFLAIVVLSALLLVRGLNLLERLSRALMPLLLLVVVALVWVAATMPGWERARDFLLYADFSRWGDTRLWVMAFGQAFYTLAIGQGYLVTYGSYIPQKTHLPRACVVVAVTETCVALLAGWMVFPLVFSFGQEPGVGSQLAFSTLPRAFENMAWGWPVAILFFALFFLAAFSSAVAGLKVIISAVSEEFRLSNGLAVLVVAGVMLLLGTPSALSFSPLALSIGGQPLLDLIDQLVGTRVVLFSGIFGAAFFCWLVPPAAMRHVLGTENRSWERHFYVVGRWLPLAVVLWLALTVWVQ